MRGENNPNWKGGTYGTVRHTEMGRAEYKVWRLAVFKRDRFTCILCGRGDLRLQAHHIQPWRSAPERWYDETNGITLCGPCHRGIGTREEEFAERFEQYTLTATPVPLTQEERERFLPFITACAACKTTLTLQKWRRKSKLHFCNVACKRIFEKAIGGDWRGYAAGRVEGPV